MREIVLDTETTGLSPQDDRIIEIGAVELVSRLPTGRTYHQYINPEMEIAQSAVRVHGITNEAVKDEPIFPHIAEAFLEFIAGSPLVIHNAPFDTGFLNAELERHNFPRMDNDIVDTLPMARAKFPGSRASLDALCQRFEIDLSGRTFHGALLDAHLLASVYLELTGGRQPDMMEAFVETTVEISEQVDSPSSRGSTQNGKQRKLRTVSPSAEELAAHATFIKELKNSFWK